MERNENEPAYPEQLIQNRDGQFMRASSFADVGGLTKRELIAAMAMQGILSNNEFGKQMRQSTDLIVGDTVSRLSLQCADALLAALATSANLKEPQQ
jgi:hypothetical protein